MFSVFATVGETEPGPGAMKLIESAPAVWRSSPGYAPQSVVLFMPRWDVCSVVRVYAPILLGSPVVPLAIVMKE